jgi:hypothetical protein
MPDLWLPGVTRLDCSAHGLLLGKGGNNRDAFHTWHTFEGIKRLNYNFSAMAGARYLASTLKLAHFTYNPVLGGLVQLLPANVAARTLQVKDTFGRTVETNRYGKIHMQTEVLADATYPWTRDMTRAGLDDLTRLMNFQRAWGVPDQWAWRDVVRPAATYAEANAPGYRRYPDRSGHAFHSKWPANSHWDPGAIVPPWTLAPTPDTPAPDPNKGFDLEHLERVESLLDVLGYDGADVWARVRAYQQDNNLTADGLPGPQTSAHLEATMTTLTDRLDKLEAKLDAALGRDPWAGRVPFQEGTSLHNTFGESFRAGALLGYAAQHAYKQAGADRDQIIAEIRAEREEENA